MSERSETNVGLTDWLDGWRDISIELPPMDVPVWLWDGSRVWIGLRSDDPDGWLWTDCRGSAYYSNGAWESMDADEDDYHPTHWRPLPQPPNYK